jgi:hypothetical protein
MGERRGAYRVLVGETLRKETTWKTAVDGTIILKWIFEMWAGWFMDWMDLAEDLDMWRAFANAVMNIWVPYWEFLDSLRT